MTGFQSWIQGWLRKKEEGASGAWLPEAETLPEGPSSFAEDSNAFAMALYGQLFQRPGNLFFSPFSIRSSLSMVCAGAKGETATQMSRALRFPSSDENVHVAFAEINQRLNAAGSGKVEMAVTKSLWVQDGAPLQPGFLDLVRRHYGGGINLVDFHRDAEDARMTINQWVENKTRQKIRELIPSRSLDSDTRLVLVNVIYFKGMWELQFDKEETLDEPFFFECGRKVKVPLMHQLVDVRYLKARGYQAVDLGYQGCDLSMLVLLPDKKDGLQDLEKRLSPRLLHKCVSQMDPSKVDLFLPRFRMTWGTTELGAQLRALGMPLAFVRFQADFSGINGYEPPHEESLFISAVFHKAFVDVNEEGTEAAAATAIEMPRCMAMAPLKTKPPPIFRADHPFLFAIRDRKSGMILFLGRITDPTLEN